MKTCKLILGLFMISLIVGCSSDDDGTNVPEPIEEQKVITTMNVTLTSPEGDVVTLSSYDEDGNGPIEPETEVNGPLAANTIYSGEIELLNEIDDENVTTKIRNEADAYQFFFSQSGLEASFAYADTESDYNDENNTDPVGLSFAMSTQEMSSGTMTITLIRVNEKDAAGVAEGDITNADGETDFEATFPISIQ